MGGVSVGEHRLVLLRHGETEWSESGQHTSTTDIDLATTGREQARLAALTIAHLALKDPIVFCSPRLRARRTAELAGLNVAEVTPLLAEWDYGAYEGRTTLEIRTSAPGWLLWTSGCPGGESVDEVMDAAREVLSVGPGKYDRAPLERYYDIIKEDLRKALE